jgi:hypothetical protein
LLKTKESHAVDVEKLNQWCQQQVVTVEANKESLIDNLSKQKSKDYRELQQRMEEQERCATSLPSQITF